MGGVYVDKMIGEVQRDITRERSLVSNGHFDLKSGQKGKNSLIIHSGLIIHHNINNMLLKIDRVNFILFYYYDYFVYFVYGSKSNMPLWTYL